MRPHFHRLACLSDFELQIGKAYRLIRGDIDLALLQSLKPRCLDRKVVRAGLQRSEEESAGLVGDRIPLRSRGGTGKTNLNTGYDGIGRIDNNA